MKFSLAVVAAFAGAAVAQDACLPQAAAIPACALGYLVSAASSVGNCGLVDFQCQCSSSAQIQRAVVDTVLSVCSASAQDVLNAVGDLCSCASANPGQQVSLNSVQSACIASAAAIPPCALGYLADAGNSIAGCAVDDFACQCSVSGSIQAAIAQTVADQCTNGPGLGDVVNSANALCACVTSAAGGAGGSGPTASPTGESSSNVGTAPGTAPTGSSPTSSPNAGGGSGTSPTASPSHFTGAAATAIPAIGGIFGAVIGLLAYL